MSTSFALITVATTMVLGGCGRSSQTPTGGQTSSSTAPASAAAPTTGVGDFGTLKGICGPGTAKGATGRGVTNSTIRIGTTADPGAAAVPGLEQEFFDVADGFSKWCNAAGGINGRKIVLDKLDAKLFNVGAITVDACQKDFMLVGGGNAFDSASVKPREACKLGSMPAYAVSPEAVNSTLQVLAYPAIATQYPIGGVRLLTDAFPKTKAGVAIGGSNVSSLIPTGKKIQEGLTQLGVKVTTIQSKPPLVANLRPYMEELKNDGSLGLYEYSGVDATPEVQAMKNVGYSPDFLLLTSNFFGPETVAASKTVSFPPTYAALQHLPFELSSQFPVMAQAESIMKTAVAKPQLADFTAIAFDAWTLWAKSATACGSTLTLDCVLGKAGAETAWTGGGMFPPVVTSPDHPKTSSCLLEMRLTTSGWVYDKKVTDPDNGVYNCDSKNLATVKTYQQ
ncbi:MAG TPA: ABC transporter substrate-binding protein [Frankiaceae bacterium]|nr:ABC transporter substrate-binding protein [Frankiaceae bacterium]